MKSGREVVEQVVKRKGLGTLSSVDSKCAPLAAPHLVLEFGKRTTSLIGYHDLEAKLVRVVGVRDRRDRSAIRDCDDVQRVGTRIADHGLGGIEVREGGLVAVLVGPGKNEVALFPVRAPDKTSSQQPTALLVQVSGKNLIIRHV
jgi:hypothetical protein